MHPHPTPRKKESAEKGRMWLLRVRKAVLGRAGAGILVGMEHKAHGDSVAEF